MSMATVSNTTAPAIEAKASLIFPNGALNDAAIAAEIARRMALTTPWMRACVENTVRMEALTAARPIVEAATVLEWSDAKDKEYWALRDSTFACSISARGNESYSALLAKAAAISDTVHARALAKINGEPMDLAIAA